MLEAVNSSVSNAPLIRGNADQTSSTRSIAANPSKVQQVAQAPFISPYIHIDVNYGAAVLALRDSETGDFLTTIPSDTKLAAQARDEASRARAEQVATYARTDTGSAPIQVARAEPAPQQVAVEAPQPNAFAAFARQVAAIQSATVGGGTGGTVSTVA